MAAVSIFLSWILTKRCIYDHLYKLPVTAVLEKDWEDGHQVRMEGYVWDFNVADVAHT